MKNCTKMNFKLSSNVLQEIHNYANENENNNKSCPTLFLKVKDVEREKNRYWLILEEESGKEIWAMFSVVLTQRILIQKLTVKPIIKLKHYYLHKFEAKNFVDNPLETYINVIGINDIEIIDEKAIKKEMKLQNNIEKLQMLSRKKRKKQRKRKTFEPELETSEESDNDSKENPEPKRKLISVATVQKVVQSLENKNQNKNKALTVEINDILNSKNIVRPPENKNSDEKNSRLTVKSIIQPSENKIPVKRNDNLKVKSIIQPSANKIPVERNDNLKVKSIIQPSENKIPVERNDNLKVKSIIQPSANKIPVERNDNLKVKSIIQPSANKIPVERNDNLKVKSIIQPSENKIPVERNDTSKTPNVVQPSENKSPNIQQTNVIPESFVGNGKTAILISSLTLTKNSPFIRACVKICGAITVSARGCSYRRCRLKDSSGEISCVIFEPICTTINNFLKVGAIIEIENAIVDEIPATMLAGSEKCKLNLRQSTKVALYNDITCVYEHPPKPSPVILPIIDNSNVKYPLLQSIKNSIRLADRADAIGVLVWMSQILDVNHNNRRVKCRNLRIQDESGSVLVSIWELTAESIYFPIGSVVSAKRARMKMVRDDLELVIDYRAKISLAEDCEEKTRLQKWYQPAARRMIPKI